MKWSCYTSLALIFVSISTFILQSPLAKENSLKNGKWALQFEIDRDFDLAAFQGTTLSIKRQTADNRAYRLGLTIFLDFGDGEISRTGDGYPYVPTRYPGDRDFNTRRIDINFQRIFYTDNSAPVNLFFGVGPTASFYHTKDEIDVRNASGTLIDFQENIANASSLGASAILGVEWFFTKDLSLLGEYGTSFTYAYSVRRQQRRYVSTSTSYSFYNHEETSSFKISSANVKFGLSVYF